MWPVVYMGYLVLQKHSESAVPWNDRTIKAQDSAIQMICENMTKSYAVRIINFQRRSSTKVLSPATVHLFLAE